MTRHLGLLRHAKTEQAVGKADSDRELLEGGWSDARAGGRHLSAQDKDPVGLVLCSTSVRTRQTWQALAEGGLTAEDVWFDRRIYNADVDTLLEVLHEVPEEVGSVLLVGHAPGVPALAQLVADPARSDSTALAELAGGYPTMGYSALSFDGPWSGLAADEAVLQRQVTIRG